MAKKIKLDLKELTDEIYDTLSGNAGMSEYHIALDPMRITKGEVDARQGKIVFQIGNDAFEIQIRQIKKSYFQTGKIEYKEV